MYILLSGQFSANCFSALNFQLSRFGRKLPCQILMSNKKSFKKYNYFFLSFSVVEGWPPDKSRNLSDYLKPHTNTTLIRPNLPLLEQMSWKGQNYSKTHILICVHSAVNSSERRNLIRRTWAKEQKLLPTKVIFLIGISNGVF